MSGNSEEEDESDDDDYPRKPRKKKSWWSSSSSSSSAAAAAVEDDGDDDDDVSLFSDDSSIDDDSCEQDSEESESEEEYDYDFREEEGSSDSDQSGASSLAIQKSSDDRGVLFDEDSEESLTLRPGAKKFMSTLKNYLDCRKNMDVNYNKLDKGRKLANLRVKLDSGGIVECDDGEHTTYKSSYRQVSETGEPVDSLEELYTVAEKVLPTYQMVLTRIKTTVLEGCGDNEDTIKVTVAPLKGRKRAMEKASDDYEDRIPGSAASWLFDVVRGSIEFSTAKQIEMCIQVLQGDKDIHIVKAKNRFHSPTLTGYRDVNLAIRITMQEGSIQVHHTCEVQLHLKELKALDSKSQSHRYYEHFRSYFSGATASLEERLKDLKKISKGGTENYASLLEKSKDEKQLSRLASLFQEHLCEYDLAHKAHEKILEIRITKHGDDDPLVGDAYLSMAYALQRMEKYDEALGLYEKALAIYKDAHGEVHLSIAQVLHNIADVHSKTLKLNKARKIYGKSLDMKRTILTADHI